MNRGLLLCFLALSLVFKPEIGHSQCLQIKGSGSSAKIVIAKLTKKQICPKNAIAISTILSGAVTELNGAAAGGVLAGTFPNPTLADGVVATNNIAALPGARVRRTSTLSVGNATTLGSSSFNQEVLFDSLVYDVGNNYSTADQRIVVPVAGVYLVTGHISWTSSNQGSRLAIIQPGAGTLGSTLFNTLQGFTSTVPNFQTFAHLVKVAAGDSIRLFAAQNSGASLSLATSSVGFAEMSVQWVAP